MMSRDARDRHNSRSGVVCLSSVKSGPETVEGVGGYTAGGSLFGGFCFFSSTTFSVSFKKQYM